MFNYSHLKYPPIKPPKLPKYFIVPMFGDSYRPKHIFAAVSSKSGKINGTIGFTPDIVFVKGHRIKSIYVEDLASEVPNQGAGTALLDFTRRFSLKHGYKGRFHLVASTMISPERIPHPFYRKYGMNTGDIEVDKRIDEFIKLGKNATAYDFKSKMMYYPPMPYEIPQKPVKPISKSVIGIVKKFLGIVEKTQIFKIKKGGYQC